MVRQRKITNDKSEIITQNHLKISGKNVFKGNIPFYIIILPTLLIVLLFRYLPMFGLILAFKDYKPKLGIIGSPWAASYGFANFIEVFKTPAFAQAIWNTFYINALALLIEFPAPIIFALLLTEVKNKYFKKTVQTISYLPHFLSCAAVTGIVNSLLNTYGLLNSFLMKFGMDPVYLLKDKSAFLPTYLITSVWQSVGWSSIIYLATIVGINPDLYEAASIDGATRFKQVWHITLPGLLPTAMILLILRTGSMFSSNFELVYGLQNQVAWTQEVISTAVYKYGIGQGEYSLSTALGLMQGLVALALTFSVNKISDKVSNISMW